MIYSVSLRIILLTLYIFINIVNYKSAWLLTLGGQHNEIVSDGMMAKGGGAQVIVHINGKRNGRTLT